MIRHHVDWWQAAWRRGEELLCCTLYFVLCCTLALLRRAAAACKRQKLWQGGLALLFCTLAVLFCLSNPAEQVVLYYTRWNKQTSSSKSIRGDICSTPAVQPLYICRTTNLAEQSLLHNTRWNQQTSSKSRRGDSLCWRFIDCCFGCQKFWKRKILCNELLLEINRSKV